MDQAADERRNKLCAALAQYDATIAEGFDTAAQMRPEVCIAAMSTLTVATGLSLVVKALLDISANLDRAAQPMGKMTDWDHYDATTSGGGSR